MVNCWNSWLFLSLHLLNSLLFSTIDRRTLQIFLWTNEKIRDFFLDWLTFIIPEFSEFFTCIFLPVDWFPIFQRAIDGIRVFFAWDWWNSWFISKNYWENSSLFPLEQMTKLFIFFFPRPTHWNIQNLLRNSNSCRHLWLSRVNCQILQFFWSWSTDDFFPIVVDEIWNSKSLNFR